MNFRSPVVAVLLSGVASAQVTERVSLGPGYQQASATETTQFGRYVSADGRFVAFMGASGMAGFTIAGAVVLLRDRQTGTTECVSLDSTGMARVGDGHEGLAVSGDGRFIAFRSQANDLVAGDTNGVPDIFLRDRLNGTTERVSVDSSGVEANGECAYPSLTDDGRFVIYTSFADNLVGGDTNGTWDVFVRDRQTATTERVSLASGNIQGNGPSGIAGLSSDGRYVAFISYATNLVTGDTNGHIDAFVHDRQTGATQRVSVASDGTQSDGDSPIAVISADGRFVAFLSTATNLVPNDISGWQDIFVRNLRLGTTERVSVGMGGLDADGDSGWPGISDDGRFVSFSSAASNLVPGGIPYHGDVFVYDRLNASTEIVSTTTGGALANSGGGLPAISSDGRYVVFRSSATDLVPNDTNGCTDIFLHDRHSSGFTSLCDPGVNNVIACPCGNPPIGPGRGCNNSSFTGGAFLTASGIAYLAQDSLVFTTQLEKPTATSVLLQGTSSATNGFVFGQGVRCAGGQLKRMYVKIAVNGSITAPDGSTNDLPVSARSAQFGLPIQPGQPYVYQVYYRDSTVLGGCNALSTFNCTQAGSVTFWP